MKKFYVSVSPRGKQVTWPIYRVSLNPVAGDEALLTTIVVHTWRSVEFGDLIVVVRDSGYGGRYRKLRFPAIMVNESKFTPEVGDFASILFPPQRNLDLDDTLSSVE